MVPFLLLGQINYLKIGVDSKHLVFSESTHFRLSTGTKKCPKILKIVVGMSKNIYKKLFDLAKKWSHFCFSAN